MIPNDRYIVFFKNSWLTPEKIGHEFVEHAMLFGNGVSNEIRSYAYNGSPHIFKATKYFDRFVKEANENGIACPFSVEELIQLTYRLLEKNNLVNAKILPILYKKEQEIFLMLSAQKASPFTVRENLEVGKFNQCEELQISAEREVGFSATNPFFFIKHGIIYTPKVEVDKTPGILRDTIIECAIALGYPVIEKSITVSELADSEVVFFSNQTYEMSFINRFEEMTFSKDWRETMAMDLLMMFRQQATNDDLNYSII